MGLIFLKVLNSDKFILCETFISIHIPFESSIVWAWSLWDIDDPTSLIPEIWSDMEDVCDYKSFEELNTARKSISTPKGKKYNSLYLAGI